MGTARGARHMRGAFDGLGSRRRLQWGLDMRNLANDDRHRLNTNCTDIESTLCQTWSWASDGALGFGCGKTGGVTPILPQPTSTTSSTTSTPTSTRPPTSSISPQPTAGAPPPPPGYSVPLSLGATIGIAVGLGVPLTLLAGCGIFLMHKHRQRKKAAAKHNTQQRPQGENAATEPKRGVATW
ncbi:hypothetical protein VTJ49DRAFT_6253 [Mycothermus thermophilus]|uniref:Uncharacterized protein n=1 Tax=Humicola insolens TaxID=85995 RepID=A0ABR3V1L0_HUMIN